MFDHSTHHRRTPDRRVLIAAAAAVCGLTGLAAGPASAAPGIDADTPDSPTTHHRYAATNVVLAGKFTVEFGPTIMGNRHQVHLKTDNGEVSGHMTSYFCPTDASVSPTWASSKCIKRQRIDFETVDGHPVGWVSSTGRSATQKGFFAGVRTSGRNMLEPSFTLYSTSDILDDGNEDFYSFWSQARAQGSMSGVPILKTAKQDCWIGGYGPID